MVGLKNYEINRIGQKNTTSAIRCPHCGKLRSTNKLFRKHMRNSHADIKMTNVQINRLGFKNMVAVFKCPLDGKLFSTLDKFRAYVVKTYPTMQVDGTLAKPITEKVRMYVDVEVTGVTREDRVAAAKAEVDDMILEDTLDLVAAEGVAADGQ